MQSQDSTVRTRGPKVPLRKFKRAAAVEDLTWLFRWKLNSRPIEAIRLLYKNVLAYIYVYTGHTRKVLKWCYVFSVDDHCRVTLPIIDNSSGSDYVNASFIQVTLN